MDSEIIEISNEWRAMEQIMKIFRNGNFSPAFKRLMKARIQRVQPGELCRKFKTMAVISCDPADRTQKATDWL